MPVLRGERHGFQHPLADGGRQIGAQGTEGFDLVLQMAGDEVGNGVAFDRALAGEQIVEDAAHGVDVGAGIERLVAELFGGDVEDRAIDGRIAFEALHGGLGDEAGEAEVEDFVLPGAAGQAGAHDVLRLEIAVDQAGLVGGHEGFERLLGGLGELLAGERGALDDDVEGFAVDEFGDDVGAFFVHAEIMDGEDVGVLDGGKGHGFAPKAFGAFRIIEERFGGIPALDGDKALQLDIPGLEDGAGAARAEGAPDFIAASDQRFRGGGRAIRFGGRAVLFHAGKSSDGSRDCRV